MGSVTYTATESLLANHSGGETVTLEIGVQDAVRSRSVEKTAQRSEGGSMEVLKHRADVTWDVTFEPVSGYMVSQLREFLDSTEGGEIFSIDFYGTSSAPKSVKRMDSGYGEEPFMRIGTEDGDMFVMRIQVLEL